uniref:Uncharacterized protein n=1 Tax=Pantoea phage Survivor TaxID=3232176 RepID=A0AAU8KXD8_9CAUD
MSYLQISQFDKDDIDDVQKNDEGHPFFDYWEYCDYQQDCHERLNVEGHAELLNEFFGMTPGEEMDYYILDKEKLEALISLFDNHNWDDDLPSYKTKNVGILEELNKRLADFDFDGEQHLVISWDY